MHLTAADYHDLVRVDAPALSPDGSTVAFVAQRAVDDETTTAAIHVGPTDQPDEVTRFTAGGGVDAQPTFSPSGETLAFTSTRGEDDRVQLWLVPTTGGEARQVTTVPGGVEDLVWSPDGTRLAFIGATRESERERGVDCDATEYDRETPDPRVVDRLVYRQAGSYLDGSRRHVYLAHVDGVFDDAHDAAETAHVTRVTGGDVDHHSPTWGDAETLYYAVSRRRDGGDPDDAIEYELVEHDRSRDETRHVTWSESWAPSLRATDDGRVFFTRTPTDDGPPVFADVEVATAETGETRVVTRQLDRTVLPGRGLVWDDDSESLYLVTPDEGSFVVRRVAVDGTHDLVVSEGEVDGLAVASGTVAVTKSDATTPGDVFVVTGDDERRLTRVNDALLDDRSLATPEEVWFDSDAGPVQGWLMLPPDADDGGDGDETDTYPLVVEIHGGPHAMWGTAGTMWHEFQTLAARGYAVFWCNPRGSLGYGEAFATATQRAWGAVTARDVLAGVETVCERPSIDDSHCFLTGGSFGGFMTAWLVGHTDRFRAAVAQRGVYDLISFYGTSDAFKLVEWDFETTPFDAPEFLWEQSPASMAQEVTTPTLVMHAVDDFRVPVNNGELLYLFLKKQGIDTRLVRYPREGHELSRSGEPGHIVDRLERIARWFDGYSDYHDVPRALDRGDDGLLGTTDAD